MTDRPSLWDKMRHRADSDGMSPDSPFRKAADELEQKTIRAYSEAGTKDDVKSMLGAWARARRLWSDYTGEPLI